MNFINIAGHLGADPEVRFTTSGKKVTTLRVATKARKGGEDVTIWWAVTVWGDQHDKMISFLKKGSPVVVFGEMQPPRMYTDREGKTQVAMEVTASHLQFSPFGKSDKEKEGGGVHATPLAPTEGAPVNPYTKAPAPAMGQTFDDEVPF
jgi:single-strand DNA-binding protein